MSTLSREQWVRAGLRFEDQVALLLANYGMQLRAVGGASDGGVDLVGSWTLGSRSSLVDATSSVTTDLYSTEVGTSSVATTSLAIPVIVQCKWSQKRRAAARPLRELDGTQLAHVFGTQVQQPDASSVLRLLVSTTAFTQQALQFFQNETEKPMALAVVTEADSFVEPSQCSPCTQQETGEEEEEEKEENDLQNTDQNCTEASSARQRALSSAPLTLTQFRLNQHANHLLTSRLQIAYSYQPGSVASDPDPVRCVSLIFDGSVLNE
eukprot:CAMPEP_0177652212 /NCGR_PEP_ID=MMETSP0447-20121125/12991_1 /TAXON_ID=0 /ORGANISM="Stygamoeba regulata, Strain BSH-02190019" /LENGTH=265 /DNA_ID=CAMNT_0019155405 /DNA_START=199 /DNA_END=996 /DNA_ORIENTATION=-